jgi:hypothetical protein
VTRRIVLFLIVCAASLAYAATAQANLLDVIAQDYADDQQIDPCKYTEKDLRALKDLVPNDVEAYDAGFSAALDDALARRAEGACKKGGATQKQAAAPPAGGTAPPPTRGTPSTGAAPAAPAVVQPPPKPTAEPTAAPDVAVRDEIGVAARASDPATDAPFPIVALAVLAGLGALGMLLFGIVRWRAWEPAWAERLRHAAGEAGWRASSTWAEFTDFVRFGR